MVYLQRKPGDESIRRYPLFEDGLSWCRGFVEHLALDCGGRVPENDDGIDIQTSNDDAVL